VPPRSPQDGTMALVALVEADGHSWPTAIGAYGT